jgi:hypothetical protein
MIYVPRWALKSSVVLAVIVGVVSITSTAEAVVKKNITAFLRVPSQPSMRTDLLRLPLTASALSALRGVEEDRAGAFGEFRPGVGLGNHNPIDWGWTLIVSPTGSARTIVDISITHLNGAEGWSTVNSSAYPLVVVSSGGNQLNTRYGDSFSVPANTAATFFLYGQRETPVWSGGQISVLYSDGSRDQATIPVNVTSIDASSFTPPSPPPSPTTPNPTTDTNPSTVPVLNSSNTTVTLMTDTSDYAGMWDAYEPGRGLNGNASDWGFVLSVPTASVRRVLNDITITHQGTPAEAWSTSNDTAYPLVVFNGYNQLNFDATDKITLLPGATIRFALYGQKERQTWAGGTARLTFSDGTVLNLTITDGRPRSSTPPPSVPPPAPPAPTVVVPTIANTTVTLKTDTSDYAGSNGVFDSGVGLGNRNPADWGFVLKLPASSASLVIKDITIGNLTGSAPEAWSTSVSSAYPLVVFKGNNQLNFSYGDRITVLPGETTLALYGQRESEWRVGNAAITLLNGTVITVPIVDGRLNPTRQTNTPPPTVPVPPTTPSVTPNTANSSIILNSDTSDYAGMWYKFEPGIESGNRNPADWGFVLDLPASTVNRVIRDISLTNQRGTEGWSTSQPAAYPLVVLKNGSQLNFAYGDRITLLPGQTRLALYAQKEGAWSGGNATISFIDGASVTLPIVDRRTNPIAFTATLPTTNEFVGPVPPPVFPAATPTIVADVAASLIGDTNENDHAGTWGVFEGDHNSDWAVRFDVKAAPVARVLSDISMVHRDGQEGWSTSQRAAYPLVVFTYGTGSQLNFSYGDRITIPANTTGRFVLYGQKASTAWTKGNILYTWLGQPTLSTPIVDERFPNASTTPATPIPSVVPPSSTIPTSTLPIITPVPVISPPTTRLPNNAQPMGTIQVTSQTKDRAGADFKSDGKPDWEWTVHLKAASGPRTIVGAWIEASVDVGMEKWSDMASAYYSPLVITDTNGVQLNTGHSDTRITIPANKDVTLLFYGQKKKLWSGNNAQAVINVYDGVNTSSVVIPMRDDQNVWSTGDNQNYYNPNDTVHINVSKAAYSIWNIVGDDSFTPGTAMSGDKTSSGKDYYITHNLPDDLAFDLDVTVDAQRTKAVGIKEIALHSGYDYWSTHDRTSHISHVGAERWQWHPLAVFVRPQPGPLLGPQLNNHYNQSLGLTVQPGQTLHVVLAAQLEYPWKDGFVEVTFDDGTSQKYVINTLDGAAFASIAYGGMKEDQIGPRLAKSANSFAPGAPRNTRAVGGAHDTRIDVIVYPSSYERLIDEFALTGTGGNKGMNWSTKNTGGATYPLAVFSEGKRLNTEFGQQFFIPAGKSKVFTLYAQNESVTSEFDYSDLTIKFSGGGFFMYRILTGVLPRTTNGYDGSTPRFTEPHFRINSYW